MSTRRAALYRRLPVTADLPWWRNVVAGAPGGRVLYLGAGTGRLAVPLARVVRRLIAVEPDPAMLASLQQTIAAAAPPVPPVDVVAAAASVVDLEQQCGAVLLPSNLLNEIPDADERAATLDAAFRHCRPDGRVVLQVLNPYWVARGGGGRGRLEGEDGTHVDVEVVDPTFEPWEQRHRARVVYRFDNLEDWVDPLEAVALFPQELRLLLGDAGLAIVERWGPRPGVDPLTDAGGTWHLVCAPRRSPP